MSPGSAEPAGWMVVAVCSILALVLCRAEWCRENRRNRWLRIIATVIACLAFALLGSRPTWTRLGKGKQSDGTRAVVIVGDHVTPDSEKLRLILERVPANHRFFLRSTPALTGSPLAVLPDLAYLRRHFPEVKKVSLAGEGLLPADLEALRGCEVDYSPENAVLSKPAIAFVSYPDQLTNGASLVVQGSLVRASGTGLIPAVALVAPDGTVTQGVSSEGGPGGKITFEVKSAPVASLGRFVWRLRLVAPGIPGDILEEEELGVAVVNPAVPRVLVLESSPHPDTASLRRWLESCGGAMSVRTTVAADRFRYTSTARAPTGFTVVDESLLAGFDLVLADPPALSSLSAAERSGLLHGVESAGLGLLVDGSVSPQENVDGIPMPGRVVPLADGGSDGDDATTRSVRPRWEGQARTSGVLLPTAPAEIQLSDRAAVTLVGDGQNHVLAASLRHGQGRVGLTLVRDTRRWLLENESDMFAGYWSMLLSELARSQGLTDTGRWAIARTQTPLFVDEPLELTWTGEGRPAHPGLITREGSTSSSTELPLAQRADRPGEWHATFWPREAGWHRVTLPGAGATLDFSVHAAGWDELRQETRRAASERFAAFSHRPSSESLEPPKLISRGSTPIPPGLLFGIILISVALLWAERYAGL